MNRISARTVLVMLLLLSFAQVWGQELTGIVQDYLGNPLPNVSLTLLDAGTQTQSDESGIFMLAKPTRIEKSPDLHSYSVRFEKGRFSYYLQQPAFVKIEVVNYLGQILQSQANWQMAGDHIFVPSATLKSKATLIIRYQIDSRNGSLAMSGKPYLRKTAEGILDSLQLVCVGYFSRNIPIYDTSNNLGILYLQSTTPLKSPIFSLNGGSFFSAQSVELSAPDSGVTIYYTTDGSAPTENSSIYSDAILVDQSMTIKTVAMRENWVSSAVATAHYNIGGTTIDSRDGHAYRWLPIGNQNWMVENLAWLPSVSAIGQTSNDSARYYVYGNDGTNVSVAKNNANYAKYGVLYNWPAASSACPAGWHLPNDAEWDTLASYVGGQSIAGTKLKSTTGWSYSGNGEDAFLFSLLPAGYFAGSYFSSAGTIGDYWSQTQNGNLNAFMRYFYYNDPSAARSSKANYYGFAVRCIQDSL